MPTHGEGLRPHPQMKQLRATEETAWAKNPGKPRAPPLSVPLASGKTRRGRGGVRRWAGCQGPALRAELGLGRAVGMEQVTANPWV